jgi:hypothetical protein
MKKLFILLALVACGAEKTRIVEVEVPAGDNPAPDWNDDRPAQGTSFAEWLPSGILRTELNL